MKKHEVRVRDPQGVERRMDSEDELRTWSASLETVDGFEVRVEQTESWVSLRSHLMAGIDEGPEGQTAHSGLESSVHEDEASAIAEAVTAQIIPAAVQVDPVTEAPKRESSVPDELGDTAHVSLSGSKDGEGIMSTQLGGLSSGIQKNPPPLPAGLVDEVENDSSSGSGLLSTQGYASTKSELSESPHEENEGPRDTEEYPHPIKSLPIPASIPNTNIADPLGPLIDGGQEISSIDVVADESYDSFDSLDDASSIDEFEDVSELKSVDLQLDLQGPAALEDRLTTPHKADGREALERGVEERPTFPRNGAVLQEGPTLRYEGRDGLMDRREPAFVRAHDENVALAPSQMKSQMPQLAVSTSAATSRGSVRADGLEMAPTSKYPSQGARTPNTRAVPPILVVCLLMAVGADLVHRVFFNEDSVKANQPGLPGGAAHLPGEMPLGFESAVVDRLVEASRLMGSGDVDALNQAQAILNGVTSAPEGLDRRLESRVYAGLAEVSLLRAERARVLGRDAQAELAKAIVLIAKAKNAEDLASLSYLEAEHARISGKPGELAKLLAGAKESGRSVAELGRLEASLLLMTDNKPGKALSVLEDLKGQPGGALAATLFRVELLEKVGNLQAALKLLDAAIDIHSEKSELIEWRRRLRTLRLDRMEKQGRSNSKSVAVKEKKNQAKSKSPSGVSPEKVSGSFADLMSEGARLLERGRARQAKDYFKAASALKPGAPEAVSNLGWCALELRDAQGAKAFFNRSLKVVPRFEDGLYGLGIAQQKLGELNAAQATFRKYLDAHPTGSKATMVRRRLEKLSGGG